MLSSLRRHAVRQVSASKDGVAPGRAELHIQPGAPQAGSAVSSKRLVNPAAMRKYCIARVMNRETQKAIEMKPNGRQNSYGRRSPHAQAAESTPAYDADNIHLLPESPPLWVNGDIRRENFLVFLNDLLSSSNFASANQLYVQLIFQTRIVEEFDAMETVSDILVDHLPAGPLPRFSEAELLGVCFSLIATGLSNHALQLWRHFDAPNGKHSASSLTPHVHYYSQAFESAYTRSADVRNVQLLVAVMEVAHAQKDSALVAELFERLVGGTIGDLGLEKVSKSDVPATPLWHTSYIRQLRTLEIGLSHLDPQFEGERIITYLNTYRLKFATCWTPKILLRFYELLAAVKANPEHEYYASDLETKIKKLSYKIATHETLQAIRNEPALLRVRESLKDILFIGETAPEVAEPVKVTSETLSKGTFGINPSSDLSALATGHPGIVNLVARAVELTEASATDNYQVIKQIYLECFELPHFFHDRTSVSDAALKLFANGNDGLAVAWIYQRMIEQGIGISVNVRNSLLFWSLRKRSDTTQCIEFFNDLLVALGPQSANGATMLLLLEAIQARGDLHAAMKILEYTRENLTSWTALKHALETCFSLALAHKDISRLKILVDEMVVKVPKTYNSRWRPQLLHFLQTEDIAWEPPMATEVSERGLFF